MELYGVIYKVTNLLNGKIYIGKGVDFNNRKSHHLMTARKGSGFAFHNAIRKYGEENFNWSIIDQAYSDDELNDKEIFWITYYESFRDFGKGYNLTTGGDGGILSKETKKKIGDANRGKKSFWYGKKHTAETKRKIGKGQIGKKYSKEARAKISETRKKYVGENHPMYGKSHSEETRKKMSKNHANFKGSNHPRAKAVIQLDKNGVFIAEYPSAIDGAMAIGKSSGKNITSCCRGNSKTAYGFIWIYKVDYKNPQD